MDTISVPAPIAPRTLSKKETNLVRWITHQYEFHNHYSTESCQIPRGIPLRLAKARRKLVEYKLPEGQSKLLLAYIRRMIRWHATVALEYHEIPFDIPEHPEEAPIHVVNVPAIEQHISLRYESMI